MRYFDMGADQTAEIRPAVRELLATFPEEKNWCVTFEVDGSDQWIQLTQDALNISWKDSREAADILTDMLSDFFDQCSLFDFQLGTYVTYSISWESVDDTARAIDWVFSTQLEAPRDYSVNVEYYTI